MIREALFTFFGAWLSALSILVVISSALEAVTGISFCVIIEITLY
jgi:hypothetical protein